MCFGEIEHELCYLERIPPDNDEQKKARIVAELKAKEHEEAKKAAEEAGEEFDAAAYPIPKIPEKKPVLMLLHLISIIDVKFCAGRCSWSSFGPERTFSKVVTQRRCVAE